MVSYASRMRVMITGAAGMLGRDVAEVARTAGHGVSGLAREDLDVTDAAGVLACVERERPDVVINCAAWTDVDGAEAAEDDATRVNGAGAGHVAAAAAAAGAFVIHVSTDYVFDGSARRPYREADPTSPVSAYGRSKLAGELAVADAAPGNHAIARTSWLFGPHGGNFVDTMRRLGADRESVTVVDDQVGCPTYTGHLATALVELGRTRPAGVLHLTGSGSCTWFELARATFARTGNRCQVIAGRTADLARPAPRPAFSVLAATRPETPPLPPWEQGLEAHLLAQAAIDGGRG